MSAGLRDAIAEAIGQTSGRSTPVVQVITDRVLAVLVVRPEPKPLGLPDGDVAQVSARQPVIEADESMCWLSITETLLRRCLAEGRAFRTDRIYWHREPVPGTDKWWWLVGSIWAAKEGS